MLLSLFLKKGHFKKKAPSWGQWPFIITVSEASIEHSSQLKEIWDLWRDKMTFMIAQDKLKATRLHDSLPLIQPVVEVFLSLQFLVFLLDNNTRKYFFKITTKQYHILPSLHIIKWILLPQFQFLLWIFKTIKHIEMFSVRIVI